MLRHRRVASIVKANNQTSIKLLPETTVTGGGHKNSSGFYQMLIPQAQPHSLLISVQSHNGYVDEWDQTNMRQHKKGTKNGENTKWEFPLLNLESLPALNKGTVEAGGCRSPSIGHTHLSPSSSFHSFHYYYYHIPQLALWGKIREKY